MYKSCNLILHGLCFFKDQIVSCCQSPVTENGFQTPPLLIDKYNGEVIPSEELFEKIHKYSEIFKKGGCPKYCSNCVYIQEKEWNEENYINEITITNFSKCNAKCIYCSNNLSRDGVEYEPYPIVPILKYYKDKGIIKKGVEFHISGGEFSIYKECDALMEEFGVTNFAKITISSNCIKYSEAIKKSIDVGNTFIIHSLDCGDRKLYKKIKGIDVFDTVIKNIKKYTSSEMGKEHVSLKYIIIPTINDNLYEFKKFLKISKNIGVKSITIEIDGLYTRTMKNKISPYFIFLAEEMKKLSESQGFRTNYFPFLKQCLKDIPYRKYNYFEQLINKIKIKNNKMFKYLYLRH